MTFVRFYFDDLPCKDWLNKVIFPMESKLTSEPIWIFSKSAILEYLSCGITAAFDMYYEPDAMVRASTDYRFRIAPLKKISECGVNIGIGTDESGSNNELNMLKKMHLASTLQKYREKDALLYWQKIFYIWQQSEAQELWNWVIVMC